MLMKTNSFLLRKTMMSEKASEYKNKKFTLEFKFKHLDFYNEIYYLRKTNKFDLMLSEIEFYLGSFVKKKKLSLSILLTNDEEIKYINFKYRNLNKPTNVLSFKSMIKENNYFKNTNQEIYLGEIIISMETIVRESKTNNVPFRDHFMHIFLHAILHILGYDHDIDSERKKWKILKFQFYRIWE